MKLGSYLVIGNYFIKLKFSLQILILIVFVFVRDDLSQGEISGMTIDIIKNFNFWAITILTVSVSCTFFSYSDASTFYFLIQ